MTGQRYERAGLKRWTGEVARSLLALIMVLAVLEVAIWVVYLVRNAFVVEVALPYVYAGDYGPVPPWHDDVRILEEDASLLWRGRPGTRRRYVDLFAPVHSDKERTSMLRQFFPTMPAALETSPRWDVSLNSEGFRDVEFTPRAGRGTLRVVCAGDSWTFGANVGQGESYPVQLWETLSQAYPDQEVEVLNLGMLGYSSFHGVRLLPRILDLQPDVVIIGFAMQEPNMAGYTPPTQQPARISDRFAQAGAMMWRRSALARLLQYAADIIMWQATSLGDRLKHAASSETWTDRVDAVRNPADLEPWLRNSLAEYEGNLVRMIEELRDGGVRVILLHPAFWERSFYLGVAAKISRERHVPLVDASRILADARQQMERQLEDRLDLRQAPSLDANPVGEAVRLVFRVHQGRHEVPTALYISGDHPQIGGSEPNRVALNDSGEAGDQRAGDRVWSYGAEVPAGTTIRYVYTNSGREGAWEGLDVPFIRTYRIDSDAKRRTVYLPIDTFGELYMYADPWHTNGRGYSLIARQLAQIIRSEPAPGIRCCGNPRRSETAPAPPRDR